MTSLRYFMLSLCACAGAAASAIKFQQKMAHSSSAAETQTWPPAFCHGLECPKYTVVTESKDYELREYSASTWVSSNTTGIDRKQVTSTLFRRLFNYIQGNNDKEQKIAMTSPVITKISPGQGPACEDTYTMSFFMSPNVRPPQPKDNTVFISHLPQQRVYVGSFGGYADEQAYVEEAGKMAAAIGDESKYVQEYYYTAGYDGPARVTDRHNEIWFIAV